MRIYTSYFGQMRNLTDNIVPVAICRYIPKWYMGLQYKKLAPKRELLNDWKKTHDRYIFTIYYSEQTLAVLDADSVVEDLLQLVYKYIGDDTKDIALICYEKPCDFCHRHLVARWLNEAGYNVKEWEKHKDT